MYIHAYTHLHHITRQNPVKNHHLEQESYAKTVQNLPQPPSTLEL